MILLAALAVFIACAWALAWVANKAQGTKGAWFMAIPASCVGAYSIGFALEIACMETTGAIPGGQPWPVITWTILGLTCLTITAIAKPNGWIAAIPCATAGALMIMHGVLQAANPGDYLEPPGSRWATPEYVVLAGHASLYAGIAMMFIAAALVAVIPRWPVPRFGRQ